MVIFLQKTNVLCLNDFYKLDDIEARHILDMIVIYSGLPEMRISCVQENLGLKANMQPVDCIALIENTRTQISEVLVLFECLALQQQYLGAKIQSNSADISSRSAEKKKQKNREMNAFFKTLADSLVKVKKSIT